ncbi:MAG: AsmA-like C-terminal domain-containing protein [Burkholderiales bacterium]|nr:AsmA-like C-terminal domain-containing protein [Burkholderiales bacterium]
MRLRTGIARWVIGAFAGVVLLTGGVVLAMPWLIDLPSIRTQVEQRLSQAMNGTVRWRSLDIRLLPTPRAVLEGAQVEIPGVLQGTVESVELELRLWPLLEGRAEIRSVAVIRPAFRVQIRPGPPDPNAQPTEPMTMYRSALEPTARILRKIAPDTTVTVRDGSADIEIAGFPSIAAVAIDLTARTDGAGLALEGAMAGKNWDRVRLNARLDYADLKAAVEADATGLKPQTVLDRLFADLGSGVEIPSLALHVKAGTDGRRSFDLAVEADAPRTRVRFGTRQIEVVEARIKSVFAARGSDLELTLTDVHLGEMVPAGRATLRLSGAERKPQLTVELDRLDLPRLRAAVLVLVEDHPDIRDYVARVRAGSITEVRVTAAADTFATLFDPSGLNASLKLDEGIFVLPVVEQAAKDVGAQLQLAGGTLRVHGVKAQVGASRVSAGELALGLTDGRLDARVDAALHLPQMLGLAQAALPPQQRKSLDVIRSLRGGVQGRLTFAALGRSWNAKIDITRSDAVVHTNLVPFPVALKEAHAVVAPGRIALNGVSGTVGASLLSEAGAEILLDGPPTLKTARARATLAVEELYAWLRSQPALAKNLERIPRIGGHALVTVNDLHGRLDRPATLVFDASIEPRGLKVESGDWPAVTVDGGSVRITPEAVALERIGARVLDGDVQLSGRIDDYRSDQRRVDARVDAGVIDHELVDWLWRRAELPHRLLPATPARFAARRILWREGKLDVAAEVQGDARPTIGIDLALAPGIFELRKLTIKDAVTDVTIRAATRGRLIDLAFLGVLEPRSVATMLQHAAADYKGRLQGDLRLTLDRDREGRTEAHGRIVGENINLALLLPMPLKLERADIEGAGSKLLVRELTANWAEQKATLRGEIERRGNGASIKAEVDSPGIDIDALMPSEKPAPTEGGGTEAQQGEPPEPFKPWPLKLTGTLAVRAGFLQWRRFRIEPLRADLGVEAERVELKVSEAALCGVAFPFSLVATPDGLDAAVKLSANGQELGSVTRCAGGEHVVLTGTFDLSAKLRAKGRAKELVRNLEGPIKFNARDGVIRKFALLGNILALKNVTGVLKKGVNLGAEGFDYKKLDVRGHFGNGAFEVEEAALDSPALGIAANGAVDLTGDKSRLTVLVAPFGRLDRLVRKLPVVGYVIGGTFTSIPVGVSGDIRNPRVVPLGPGAVTSELTGIFERTLKLPGKLLAPTGGEAPEP